MRLWAAFIRGLIAGDNGNDDNECGFARVCACAWLSARERAFLCWRTLRFDFVDDFISSVLRV